mmetsp:Transcript_49168/g.73315  ORF Transcript_49168/g.73315 Transcript_49168/m.73315 type:complete len:209 (+) Transcript_49168:198-824(+)
MRLLPLVPRITSAILVSHTFAFIILKKLLIIATYVPKFFGWFNFARNIHVLQSHNETYQRYGKAHEEPKQPPSNGMNFTRKDGKSNQQASHETTQMCCPINIRYKTKCHNKSNTTKNSTQLFFAYFMSNLLLFGLGGFTTSTNDFRQLSTKQSHDGTRRSDGNRIGHTNRRKNRGSNSRCQIHNQPIDRSPFSFKKGTRFQLDSNVTN